MISTLLAIFILFHRLDGHIVWVNPSNVTSVQGAGQLGHPTGTLISFGGVGNVVKENVSQVIRKLREAEDQATCKPPATAPASVPSHIPTP